MSRILLIIALLLAFIATLLGFNVFDATTDQHVLGWVAASLFAFFASLLVPDSVRIVP